MLNGRSLAHEGIGYGGGHTAHFGFFPYVVPQAPGRRSGGGGAIVRDLRTGDIFEECGGIAEGEACANARAVVQHDTGALASCGSSAVASVVEALVVVDRSLSAIASGFASTSCVSSIAGELTAIASTGSSATALINTWRERPHARDQGPRRSTKPRRRS